MSEFGPLASFLSSCTWAIGATGYSALSTRFSSPAINTARALVALPLFLLTFLLLEGQSFHLLFTIEAKRWFWFFMSVVGSYAIGDVLFLLSTRSLGVPSALAIASIYPVWSAVAGFLFRGNAFHPAMFLGVVMVVAGTIAVILSGKEHTKEHHVSRRGYWVGVVLAVLTSFFWTLNAFSLSVATEGVSPFLANVIRMSMALVFCPLVGIVLHRSQFRLLPPAQMISSSGLFVLEAFGGSIFFIYGVSHSPLATAAALSSLAPVLALCLAWGLGKEKVSAITSAAIVTVVLGIWFLVGGQL